MTTLNLAKHDPIVRPLSKCAHDHKGDDCRVCQVRPLGVCAVLEPNEWSAIEKISQTVNFAERDTLVSETDDCTHFYSITAGVARLTRSLPDGRRQVMGFALPSDFLGLSLGKTWSFSVEAIAPITACRFARHAIINLIDQKPHFLMRMHEMASTELNLAQDHMVLLGRLSAEEKIGTFLIEMRRRWARIDGHISHHVPLPMGRQDIADYLGLTIETVSRTINLMQRERHLVIVPDGIRLVDAAYFEALSPSL
jgi:CRP/FNR family transcriptional regulator, anaerobic regulatory protein